MARKNDSKEELRAALAEAQKRIGQLEALESQCELTRQRELQQNRFLHHVIESLPHPFYVLDAADYTIKLANSAAGFGELSQNTTCYALTHRRSSPCGGSDHSCPLQVIKETGKPVILEHVHYNSEGRPRNVEVHASPVFDEAGNVVQIIEYSLDITERKQLEDELKNYAEKIKLFAYSISHDIKSPVIGINGLTRLLHRQYRDNLDERAKRYCDQILKASEQVLTLIEEINAYIKAREWPLSVEVVDLEEVLRTVRGEFDIILRDRQISWYEPEPKSIPGIRADKTCMLRVFRNLVDNALKYGGEQLSEIRIGYEKMGDFHTFSVRDNGAGIQREACQRIFELFERHESVRGTEGTGLGLAIVKEIAEKHGGRAWVDSDPGVGATFFISLSKDL